MIDTTHVQIVYIGKCSDGAFWHLIVTETAVHVYRRFHNGLRWVTSRFCTFRIGDKASRLVNLPREVARKVRELARSSTQCIDCESLRRVLSLVCDILEIVQRCIGYLDLLPHKVKERLRAEIARRMRHVLDESTVSELPEPLKSSLQGAETVHDVLDSLILGVRSLLDK